MRTAIDPARARAVRAGVAVALATISYGVPFGALATASGLDVVQTCVLSLLMFTGGSQFALVGVVAGGGPPASAFGAATLLGLRNAVYGMQVKALLRPRGWRRLAVAQVTIDESTAMALAQSDPAEQRRGFLTAGVGVFVLWNAFTVLGALAGNALGDPEQWGLDAAATAAFLALLWPRLVDGDAWAVAAVCALVTVLAVPVLPAGLPILAAAVVAAVIGWLR